MCRACVSTFGGRICYRSNYTCYHVAVLLFRTVPEALTAKFTHDTTYARADALRLKLVTHQSNLGIIFSPECKNQHCKMDQRTVFPFQNSSADAQTKKAHNFQWTPFRKILNLP